MATLNAAIDNVNNRIQWDHNCDQALQELRERMKNLKRKMYDPVELLDDGHCIVIMGDAAETGIGAGIFLIAKGNADDVVPEDVTASTTVLIDVYHKVLNTGQRKWQVFELEAFAMFTSVDRWSRYISRALHKKDHWPVNKIAMLTDSTTAAVKFFNLQLPEYDIKHLCSKGRQCLPTFAEQSTVPWLAVQSCQMPFLSP